MEIVLKPAAEFAPRTRNSTADRLVALKPTLDAVQKATVDARAEKADAKAGVFTIVEKVTAKESASLVALLNAHYSRDWTFAARSTGDGTSIVQAQYDPANQRPVRTVNRKASANGAGKAGKAAKK